MVLAGCGIDPGAKYMPAVLRAADPPTPPVEAAPDVRQLLTSNLASVFLPSAHASNISFSPPKPALGEWSSCIQATVTGIMGNAIGRHTYLVNIARGKVSRQELVNGNHWCRNEPFEPL